MSIERGIWSVRGRATWAKSTLVGVGLAQLMLALTAFNLASGGSTFDTYDTLTGLYALAALATAVVFISWSYRAHANLKPLGRVDIRHQDQATVWWWIVPIAFLFMPFRVVYETVRGSLADLDDRSWRVTTLHPSAIWWTILFIVGIIGAQVSASMANSAATFADLEAAVNLTAFSSLSLTGAAAAAFVMVQRVTDAQTEKKNKLTAAGSTDALTQTSPSREKLSARSEHEDAEHEPSRPTMTEETSQTYCRKCGEKFIADDKYCGRCGSAR